MKVLFSILFSFALCITTPKLSALRLNYPKANSDLETTNKLYKELTKVSKEDDQTLVAYKGAIATLKAKYAKGIKNKTSYFKEGAQLIEFASQSEPDNIEIRCIRLSVQENAPKIVRYSNKISEDKKYILEHYHQVDNPEIKKFIKNYVLLSNGFSTAEKQLF